jgi:hypothetical protein
MKHHALLSVALTVELAYRVFFHVYDRTGVGLVADDRHDVTPEPKEGGVTC